nr:hypothetical protein [Tanacetum cinerariifolium]
VFKRLENVGPLLRNGGFEIGVLNWLLLE